MRLTHLRRIATITALGISIAPISASAQYFGRNKVQYEDFDFRVLNTPHFNLHFYPVEADAARDMARIAERWETRLSGVFNHQLSKKKPIIIYADQPDFQQTNAVSEQLTEGTGGVTEGLRETTDTSPSFNPFQRRSISSGFLICGQQA